MSPELIKTIIAGALLLHGLGHGGAIGALIAIDRGVPSGKWRAARSWRLPYPFGVSFSQGTCGDHWL